MIKLSFMNKMDSLRAISATGAILAPIVGRNLVPYPYMMMLVATRHCDSHCKMCNIWQEKDLSFLSINQIRWIFDQNDFSFVRILVLTGGEPTLRSDLPEILKIAGIHCPNLRLVQLATNGLNPSRVVAQVKRMLILIEEELGSIYRLDIQVSVDGIGEVHDWIRGIPGAFQRVVETLDHLAALRKDFPKLGIRLSAVVLPSNLSSLKALHTFALERELPITFTPVILSTEYYANLQNKDLLSFSVDQRAQTAEFFYRLAQREQSGLRYHYMDVSRMLLGNPRQRKCMMGLYGFVIENNGNIYPCVNCENYSFGSLLNARFEEVWFGSQASYARQRVRWDCCSTCASLCYPLPANLAEVVDIVLRRLMASFRR